MKISEVFDVFSRRTPRPVKGPKALTQAFRNRILMVCRDRFSNVDKDFSGEDYRGEFMEEVHRRLTYLVGKAQLSGQGHFNSKGEDVARYLLDCRDEHFLDFVEYIFQAKCYRRVCTDENTLVQDINHLFLLDDLPYAVTPFVREKCTEELHGVLREVEVLVAYPKVIRRDDQVLYSQAIAPAIQLLIDKGFAVANEEFLKALEDYRRGEYGDCLTKCCSAFESTMKVICARKGLPYAETDTAGTLLSAILSNSNLENFFEQPLVIIATLRNRLSSSHGGGNQPRVVSPHKAKYALNSTAAAILLLVEECT